MRIPVIVVFLICCGTIAVRAQTFSDEFNGSVDQRWEWIRMDAVRQFVSGSELTIITQNGALYGTQYNNEKNILLQQASLGSYSAELKVTFSGDSTFHNAGLVYYLDDDNYLSVAKGFYLGQHVAIMAWDYGGGYTLRTTPISSLGTIRLRLVVNDNRYFGGFYSYDGVVWDRISSAEIGFVATNPRIGLHASNGEGVNVTRRQIPARFDYFRIDQTVGKDVLDESAPAGIQVRIVPHPALRGSIAKAEITCGSRKTVSIRISDVTGKTVLEIPDLNVHGQTGVSLPVQDLPAGYYWLLLMERERETAYPLLIHGR